jgi:hypothetical protein
MYPDLLDVQKQMKGLEMVYNLYEEQLVGTSKQRFENTEGLSISYFFSERFHQF